MEGSFGRRRAQDFVPTASEHDQACTEQERHPWRVLSALFDAYTVSDRTFAQEDVPETDQVLGRKSLCKDRSEPERRVSNKIRDDDKSYS